MRLTEAGSVIIAKPSSSGSLVNEQGQVGKVPVATGRTQGLLCLVKEKASSLNCITPNHVCSASSALRMYPGPVQPALLIKQRAHWLLLAHCMLTLLSLVSSVPTLCQSSHYFPPGEVHPSFPKKHHIHSSSSPRLCSCSPSPRSPGLSCLLLKSTSIQS